MGEWGNGNTASLAVSYNDASNSTYLSPSLADWQAQGRGYNLSASYGSGDLNYWNLYRQPFRNLYFAAPVHLALGTGLTLDATSYLQFGYGNSPYGASIGPDGYYPGTYLGTQALDAPLKLSGLENGGTVNVLGNWLGEQTRAGQTLRLTLVRGVIRSPPGCGSTMAATAWWKALPRSMPTAIRWTAGATTDRRCTPPTGDCSRWPIPRRSPWPRRSSWPTASR
jgi:hypothetical protein